MVAVNLVEMPRVIGLSCVTSPPTRLQRRLVSPHSEGFTPMSDLSTRQPVSALLEAHPRSLGRAASPTPDTACLQKRQRVAPASQATPLELFPDRVHL
jgi:hypothetical protein